MDITGIAKSHHAGIPKASSKKEWKLSDSLRERIAECEYKDYPSNEWIASYLTVDGGAMLYKEVNVTNIPDGLQSEYEWND